MTITDPYKEIHALREKIAKLYDEYAGAPCAQIAWMQEKENLSAEVEI